MADGKSWSVELPDQSMDCIFHPSENLLALGLISGRLQVFKIDDGKSENVLSLRAHKESCRAVRFSPEGSWLVTASADQSILALDTETLKTKARRKAAHEAAINRLTYVSDSVLASGDDSGCVKLWDMRQADTVASFQEHTDYVADMTMEEAAKCLLSVSGDGTLAVLDMRTNKLLARSELDADDELLSVVTAKKGRKVICGAQSGVLSIFSWGFFADCSDRFPGHPASVDALVKFDEDTVLTGSADGAIRILNILPNRMLGVVGAAEDLPIERLALSGDRSLLASTSHDPSVTLWDLGYLLEEDDDEAEEAAEDGVATEEAVGSGKADGEAGLENAEAGSDAALGQGQKRGPPAEGAADSSDSDDDEKGKKKKKGKRDGRGAHKISKKKKGGGDDSFFSDLL